MQRLVSRCLQGFTWRGAGIVAVYCALYGAVLSLDPDTGGAPQSPAAYLVGFVSALELFVPAYLVVTVTSGFAIKRPVLRSAMLGIAVLIGVAIGYCAMTSIEEVLADWQRQGFWAVLSLLPYAMVGWLGLAIYLLQERDAAVQQALHDEADHQLNLDRQMSEAQLQVLQSQIEPHFLFNTLAHVRRLYQTDSRAGRAMMRHLSRYLSAALPAMRETGIKLAQDVELAVTYLNIQKIRMGPRLAFEVDIPSKVGDVRIPPMMVTTLVENAIKHGLSALPEGGMVRIDTRLRDQTLEIRVSDTGQGFQASLGSGVGLANIRARLTTLYGSAAQLALSRNTPRGVTATVIVPIALAGGR
jgi:sensor histidine kinase YesM